MSTLRAITWEDMFYLAWMATLWRTTSKDGDNVYQYEEYWFAAVSCLYIRNFNYFDGGSSTLSSSQLLRWWIVFDGGSSTRHRRLSVMIRHVGEHWIINIMDVIPCAMSDEWPVYGEVFCYLMNSCIKTVLLMTKQGCDSQGDILRMNGVRWSFLFQMKHFHQVSVIAHEARSYDLSYYSWNIFRNRPPLFSSATWSTKRWWVYFFIRPAEVFYISISA